MAKTHSTPKQLIALVGKPIIEHILDALPDVVDELVFIVGGPHEEAIRNHFSEGVYGSRKITFVRQEEQLGLAHAFWQARDVVSGRWMGMVADDIYTADSLKRLAEPELAILSSRSEHPENFGVLVPDDDGYLVRAVEKPQEFVSDLIWNGAMVMDERFMNATVEPSGRGEYETPDVWMKLIEEQDAKIKIVESDFWLPINDGAQLEEAEQAMRNHGLA